MHLKRVYFIVTLAIIAVDTTEKASADDQLPYGFPVYAIDAVCNAAFADVPDENRRADVFSCLDLEQKALDLLKSIWKTASSKIEDLCETESRGSYAHLYQCVSSKEKQDKLPLQLLRRSHTSSSPSR